MKPIRQISFPLAIWLAAALPSAAPLTRADEPLLRGEAISRALATLQAPEYLEELRWWADDERGGREAGSPGSVQAAERAAEQFRRLGLEPVGDLSDGRPGYFQLLEGAGMRGVLSGSRLAAGGRTFEHGKDWSLLGGCDDVKLERVEVVFAGYGITAPEYEYDDYAGIDAKGKAVLVLRYEPQERDERSKWKGAAKTEHSFLARKVQNAKKQGALAVLLVDGPLHHDPETEPLSDVSTPAGDSMVPMVHVRKCVADALLAGAASGASTDAPAGGADGSGVGTAASLLELQKKIDSDGRPASTSLPGILLDLSAKVAEVSRARNVMALLKGSDPRLKDEVVIVGAHYDHIGRGARGSRTPNRVGEVHNGADDNASGSVGVLELAEAFVEGGLRPKRSILFQLYDAEEKGLVGSRQYVERPPIPLERTVGMINLDMIGHVRDDRCSVMGTDTTEDWTAILDEAEKGSPLKLRRGAGGAFGSDQFSFLRKGIPVLFFHCGLDSPYHTPDDDADRCNTEGAVEVLKVVLKATVLLAGRETRPTFARAQVPGPAHLQQRRARLGVTIQDLDAGRRGARVDEVLHGSAADKAGLRPGDVIISVNGAEVSDVADLQEAIGKHRPGETIVVRYRRGAKEEETRVALDGERRSIRV